MVNCSINGTLDALWSSSAPFTALLLGDNSFTGTLPGSTLAGASLGQLEQLNLTRNELQGTMPLAWVQTGGVLCHVTLPDLGNVWTNSLRSVGWRQQLCLTKGLYNPDVTGHSFASLPATQKHLQDVSIEITDDNYSGGAVLLAQAYTSFDV